MDPTLALRSLEDYLTFLAMDAFRSAVESGDHDHYRHEQLDLADLFSDLWDDRKFLLTKAYFALKDDVRARPEVARLVRDAYPTFMALVQDEPAMSAIFGMTREEKQNRRRVFDGVAWIAFSEWEGYDADVHARALAELG